jgi:hypothetical protein
VSVLVLNYNGLRWLPQCLSSIAATDYPNLDVYLVDNGSTDDSVDYVRRSFPSVRLLLSHENLGFAEGYNGAISKISSEHIVLLNNDTEVLNPKWIRHLVDKASSSPSIVAVACKMVSLEDHSRLDSVGGMGIPFWRGFVDIGREEPDHGQYDQENFEPFAFCGGAALIKRSIFIRLGGFDGRFFLYTEDVDLSWRLRLFGYRVGFAPQAQVAHYFSGSSLTKETDARKLYYCHRNLLRVILKNCGPSLGWAVRNYLLFTLMIVAGFSIFEPKKAVAATRAVLWNLVNLRDTCSRRKIIQANRKVSEAKVLDEMYPNLRRYQPAEHPKLRRVLNVLFEYAQRYRPRKLSYT